MKVVVRAAPHPREPITLFTVNVRWDSEQRRFLMQRAIGDGFYDTWPETSIKPLSVDVSDAMVILVQSADDAKMLAKELSDLSEFCNESYRHSRT